MKSKLFYLTVLFIFGMTSLVKAQTIDVSGKVTASGGEPLPGVTVVEQGTTNGATTDAEGRYSIQANENATLVFSFVGYNAQKVDINGKSVIDVQLNESVVNLEEVVAIGYGTQRKSDLTGSVTSIGTESFNEGMISSPEQLI
ncbi:MAG: carboxypeptidase-like regulatory domain-containing protein, partial [Prolixibacteraceae bacterium]|nr:carboxypeptidase-like regulatory domain-containing protein [Prolixibacteraceae bacterium]